MATIDTIAGVLESNLDIDPATVTPEATFESLGIDSLDMVELAVSRPPHSIANEGPAAVRLRGLFRCLVPCVCAARGPSGLVPLCRRKRV